MNEPLLVLLIEDDEDDALLLESALRSGGLEVRVQRVETPEQLREAIRGARHDVVISDYHLPGFDVRQALEIVKEERADLPVIVVSGSVPEEVIVETVKAGARDYLMKPNLTRLPVAVEREIQEAADRRALHGLEEQLRHLQRLESLGVLAGGVAHDFNNVLTGIMANASLATELLPAGNPVTPLLESVVSAAEHAATLTRQLLAYAGKGQFIVEPIDLSELVRSTFNLLRLSVSRNVEMRCDLAGWLPPVIADLGQVEQILMNLAINASEAIGTSAAGEITIATGVSELPAGAAAGNVAGNELESGKYVYLSVADNGPGIAPEVRSKIFDPFFTTKFTGRGLGLSAVLGIVRSHRGSLRVESEVGKGTRFIAHFPANAAARLQEKKNLRQQVDGLSGVVLVIDDEEIVRKTARAVLQQHGLSVVMADNGSEGMDVFRKMADRVGIVLLDLTMPVMSGEATLQAIRQIRPDIPVLISSGYNEEDARERLHAPEGVRFIQKPYGSIELARAVQDAMQGHA